LLHCCEYECSLWYHPHSQDDNVATKSEYMKRKSDLKKWLAREKNDGRQKDGRSERTGPRGGSKHPVDLRKVYGIWKKYKDRLGEPVPAFEELKPGSLPPELGPRWDDYVRRWKEDRLKRIEKLKTIAEMKRAVQEMEREMEDSGVVM